MEQELWLDSLPFGYIPREGCGCSQQHPALASVLDRPEARRCVQNAALQGRRRTIAHADRLQDRAYSESVPQPFGPAFLAPLM
jgi:hypothetical protein